MNQRPSLQVGDLRLFGRRAVRHDQSVSVPAEQLPLLELMMSRYWCPKPANAGAGSVGDRLADLRAGVLRPLGAEHLLVRVAGGARLATEQLGTSRVGPVEIDHLNRVARWYARPVELKSDQFELLRAVSTLPGRTFTAFEIEHLVGRALPVEQAARGVNDALGLPLLVSVGQRCRIDIHPLGLVAAGPVLLHAETHGVRWYDRDGQLAPDSAAMLRSLCRETTVTAAQLDIEDLPSCATALDEELARLCSIPAGRLIEQTGSKCQLTVDRLPRPADEIEWGGLSLDLRTDSLTGRKGRSLSPASAVFIGSLIRGRGFVADATLAADLWNRLQPRPHAATVVREVRRALEPFRLLVIRRRAGGYTVVDSSG